MKKLILYILIIIAISCFACSPQKDIVITDTEIPVINEYLETQTDNLIKTHWGETKISAFYLIGIKGNSIFIWAFIGGYKKMDKIVEVGERVSLPIVLYTENGDDGFKIIKYKYPRDGNKYRRDINRLFPPEIRKLIYDTDNITALPDEAESRAEEIIK